MKKEYFWGKKLVKKLNGSIDLLEEREDINSPTKMIHFKQVSERIPCQRIKSDDPSV